MSGFGVIGLGLIGGSIAQALAQNTGGVEVLGYDPTLTQEAIAATELPIELATSAQDVLERCSVVFLAAPTHINAELLELTPADGPLLIDVGSVKSPIVRQWQQLASQRQVRLVPTHPMAGSEFAGWSAARPDLFGGATWAIVLPSEVAAAPLAQSYDVDVLQTIRLITALGALAVPCSPAGHDQAVAVVSHLPHVLAATIGRAAYAQTNEELTLALAGGSYRDMTRVSGAPPDRTAEFISVNDHFPEVLEAAAAELQQLAQQIRSHSDRETTLQQFLMPAQIERARYLVKHEPASPSRTFRGTTAEVVARLRELSDTGVVVSAVNPLPQEQWDIVLHQLSLQEEQHG